MKRSLFSVAILLAGAVSASAASFADGTGASLADKPADTLLLTDSARTEGVKPGAAFLPTDIPTMATDAGQGAELVVEGKKA